MAVLTRKQVLEIVVDAIQEVNIDAMTTEEEDEVADLVAGRLMDEAPDLVEDDEEEAGEDA
jgi:hypothetical protein